MNEGARPLDRAAALSAVHRWSFIPPQAQVLTTDDYELLRLPDWWEQPLELRRFDVDHLDEALQRACGFGLPHVCCWVRLGSEDDDALRARGGVLHETLDVLARSIGPGDLPDLAPPVDLTTRRTSDPAVFRDADAIGGAVFGGEPMSEEDLAGEAARAAAEEAAGLRRELVAYLDGQAVGTGGLSLVDPGVARLWGGATVPEARRRGVYRTLLDARLRLAVEAGASLALVKGRVETSGPVLRRAGFEVLGQERSYLVPLSA